MSPAPGIFTDGVHLVVDRRSSDSAGSAVDDLEALHDFARRLGLRRSWFQGGARPHYDLTTPAKAEQAVRLGAQLIAVRDVARLMSPDRPAAPGWQPAVHGGPVDELAQRARRENIRLMRLFAPGRRVGRRGDAHLTPAEKRAASSAGSSVAPHATLSTQSSGSVADRKAPRQEQDGQELHAGDAPAAPSLQGELF